MQKCADMTDGGPLALASRKARKTSSWPYLGGSFSFHDEAADFRLRAGLEARRAAVGLLEVRPVLAQQPVGGILVGCSGLSKEQLCHGRHIQCLVAPCDHLYPDMVPA